MLPRFNGRYGELFIKPTSRHQAREIEVPKPGNEVESALTALEYFAQFSAGLLHAGLDPNRHILAEVTAVVTETDLLMEPTDEYRAAIKMARDHAALGSCR